MGKLRRPRQQAGAKPSEEVEHRLERSKTGGQALLDQQSDRQRDAEQVVIMQIWAGERSQQQYGNGSARPR
jgi:hypothetical protein